MTPGVYLLLGVDALPQSFFKGIGDMDRGELTESTADPKL